jgi:MFS family permease
MSPAEREQRRWLRVLAIPFAAASILMAAALSGAGAWLLGVALVCGVGLGIASLVYLTLTSDLTDATLRHRVVVVGGGLAGPQNARTSEEARA